MLRKLAGRPYRRKESKNFSPVKTFHRVLMIFATKACIDEKTKALK